jgi:hypothetical protein
MYIPVRRESSWTFHRISGTVDVQAIPDPSRSNVALCRREAATLECPTDVLENTSHPLLGVLTAPFDNNYHTVRITPWDMDGLLINRDAASDKSRQSLRIDVLVFSETTNATRIFSARPIQSFFPQDNGSFPCCLTVHAVVNRSFDYGVDIRVGPDAWFTYGRYRINIQTDLGTSSKAVEFEVQCATGYALSGVQCIAANSATWQIGLALALAFAAVLGILLYLVRKNKARAREIIKSFLQFEAMLTAEVLVETWDLCGDILSYLSVVGDDAEYLRYTLVPYTALLGLAVVASFLASVLKARLLYQFIQWRRKVIAEHDSEPTDEVQLAIFHAKRQLEEKQYDYRFRTLGTYSYMLLAVCEDLPMCDPTALAPPWPHFVFAAFVTVLSVQGRAERILSDGDDQGLSAR